MADCILDDISHRRYNILRGSYVLVSPHRAKRPWQGQQESPSKALAAKYEPSCYLCPGNKRAQGHQNPQYMGTFAFINDFSAVKEDQPAYHQEEASHDLASTFLKAEEVTGRCYVLIFSPTHNLTLADLSPIEITRIVHAWTEIYLCHLSSHASVMIGSDTIISPDSPALQIPRPKQQYRYMQIFENKGAAMGCSNPHPHGQIWTTSTLPEEPAQELEQLKKYRRDHPDKHLLEDYVLVEIEKRERIVFENESFLVLCPWWAVWPYETMIVSKSHRRSLADLTMVEKERLADAIAEITRRYDNLFETHFPYSMGIHQAPLDASTEEMDASHLHLHFYPPLLRSASVRKFLVGYELLAEPQRDITPEQAASRLRACGGQLYRKSLDSGAN